MCGEGGQEDVREYRLEPHLKHLVLFMCKHRAAPNLINNRVSTETLGKPDRAYFSVLNTWTRALYRTVGT